jgi:hypothetical protein
MGGSLCYRPHPNAVARWQARPRSGGANLAVREPPPPPPASGGGDCSPELLRECDLERVVDSRERIPLPRKRGRAGVGAQGSVLFV